MNENEIEPMMKRITRFQNLRARELQLGALLRELSHADPEGPRKKNPYTGDHNESRCVREVAIWFTQTIVGDPAVNKTLTGLNIPADEFGEFIENQLKKQAAKIRQEIDAL